MSSQSAAAHVHHPNADSSATFRGLAAYEKGGDVKLLEYNPPHLADNFIEVLISHCGICGTDLHRILNEWGGTNYPVIPGHEIVGTVSAVGAQVTNVKVGDRVGIGAQAGSCLNRQGDCYECQLGWDNHCTRKVGTYNYKQADGQVMQGGYADRKRVQSDYAFVIPESISSEHAAPLMCAGATVFAPLSRAMTRKGMRVAVVGIGGLGHIAVQFASRLLDGSAEVTAISHNDKRKAEALKLGATKFVDTSDAAAVKAHSRYFDYILCTANGSSPEDYSTWLSMIRLQGSFCTVGLPATPMPIHAFSLTSAQVAVTGSSLASTSELKAMLDFVAAHPDCRPIIERLPMAQANEGLQRMRDGKVRFRVVLHNDKAGELKA